MEKSVIKGSEWLALLLAAAAIITQSFVPPIVGIANNGDFPKIIGQFDVGSPSDAKDSFRFVDTKYVVDSRYHYESRFYSSEVFLFEAALGLNSVFGRPGVLDLRLMGAVHAALFLLAFYLFLPLVRLLSVALRLVVFLAVLLIFTDVMYVSYFNSFYMDTAALLFLLLSVVSFVRALLWQRLADRWLFVASAALLVASKTQHYPLGIPIALLLAWKGGVLIPGRSGLFRSLSAATVLAASAFTLFLGAPSYYHGFAAYNVIFFQLLPRSKDVASDLKALGLDDSYRRYIGTHAYTADAAVRDPRLEDVFTYGNFYSRIARIYLKDPSRAVDVISLRMDGAGMQRPLLGNFERSAGFPESARSRTFALWSDLKILVFARNGGLYLFYSLSLLMAVMALAIVRRQSFPPGLPLAIGTLGALMLVELAVVTFADSLDPEREYFLFNTLTDLLLVCGICLTARRPRQISVQGALEQAGSRVKF